jgi:hypothetical protein
MSEQYPRPQDPIPPSYQSAPSAERPYQAYQPYPAGYPGPQPYPVHPPGYYPGYPPQGIAPPNHLAWAIISIFLFWPVGIAAIIKSTQVEKFWMMGRPAMAEAASRSTKTLCVVCTVLAGAFFMLWLLLSLVIFSQAGDMIPPPPR